MTASSPPRGSHRWMATRGRLGPELLGGPAVGGGGLPAVSLTMSCSTPTASRDCVSAMVASGARCASPAYWAMWAAARTLA